MAVIFGGKSTYSLAALRHDILTKKVISAKSFVMPERPPPNSIVSGCLWVLIQQPTGLELRTL